MVYRWVEVVPKHIDLGLALIKRWRGKPGESRISQDWSTQELIEDKNATEAPRGYVT
jgi:hypothetical protein